MRNFDHVGRFKQSRSLISAMIADKVVVVIIKIVYARFFLAFISFEYPVVLDAPQKLISVKCVVLGQQKDRKVS